MVPFIEKNVDNISVEDVNPYNQVVAGRIISWVINAIRLRKGDITRRKALFRRSIDEASGLIFEAREGANDLLQEAFHLSVVEVVVSERGHARI